RQGGSWGARRRTPAGATKAVYLIEAAAPATAAAATAAKAEPAEQARRNRSTASKARDRAGRSSIRFQHGRKAGDRQTNRTNGSSMPRAKRRPSACRQKTSRRQN